MADDDGGCSGPLDPAALLSGVSGDWAWLGECSAQAAELCGAASGQDAALLRDSAVAGPMARAMVAHERLATPRALAWLAATRRLQGCTALAEGEATVTEAEFRLAPYEDDESVSGAAEARGGEAADGGARGEGAALPGHSTGTGGGMEQWAKLAGGRAVQCLAVAPQFRRGWETALTAHSVGEGGKGECDGGHDASGSENGGRPDAHGAAPTAAAFASALWDLPREDTLAAAAASVAPTVDIPSPPCARGRRSGTVAAAQAAETGDGSGARVLRSPGSERAAQWLTAESPVACVLGPELMPGASGNAAAAHPVAATAPLGPRPLAQEEHGTDEGRAAVLLWEVSAPPPEQAPRGRGRPRRERADAARGELLAVVESLASSTVQGLLEACTSALGGGGRPSSAAAIVGGGIVAETGGVSGSSAGGGSVGRWLQRWSEALEPTAMPSGMAGLVARRAGAVRVGDLRPRLAGRFVLLLAGDAGSGDGRWYEMRCVDVRQRCAHDDPRDSSFPAAVFARPTHRAAAASCSRCGVRPGCHAVAGGALAWLPVDPGDEGAAVCGPCFEALREAGAFDEGEW